MSKRIGMALLLACLPAIMFLLQDGYFSSSDGMIHLYRVFELDRSLRAGILFPRWFPLSGYGYGLPVLNFYPPLAYYLAEFFHLAGAGYIVSIKLLIALGFLIAAISMFLFARDLIGERAAFVAGVSFAYLPYLLSDAYVRGNFPEFLAMSLIPLALLAFRRVYERSDKIQIIGAAFALAAIVLSHHLTAMLFAVLLAGYIAWIFLLRRDLRALLRCIIAGGVGLALSIFYWYPALADLNLVYVGPSSDARFIVTRLIDPLVFFAPSLAYTFLPQVEALTHAPGFPQTIFALLVGIIGLRFTFHASRTLAPNASAGVTYHDSRVTHHVLFFLIVVVLALGMTLTIASPLWYVFSPLRFLQFPWRFHVLAGVGMAFLIGVGAKWILDRARAPLIVVPGFSIILILLGVWNLPLRAFPLTDAQIDLPRSTDNDYVVAQMGWGWTREFVPAGVTDYESICQPIVSKPSVSPTQIDPPRVAMLADDLNGTTMRVSTVQSFELSLHTFYFPGWQAYIDDLPAPTYARSSLGLTTVNVPPGDHLIRFQFDDTLSHRIFALISITAFVLALAWLFFARRRFAITIVILIFFFAILLWRNHANGVQPGMIPANLDQQAVLIGYSTDRSDTTIQVTLYWLALQNLSRDYTAFVQFIDPSGAIVAQNDGYPDQSLTPTTRWIPGEVIADRHNLAVQDIPPGDYRLTAGMYFVADQGYTGLGSPVDLGNLKVTR